MNVNLIVSPMQLWKDAEEITSELEETEIFNRCENGTVCRGLYFTGKTAEDGKIRVYTEICYSEQTFNKFDGKMPTIILTGDHNTKDNVQLRNYYLNGGYAVICVELFGDDNQRRFTIYPASYNFAKYTTAKNNLFHVPDSPKNTCWYVWSFILRRIVTLAQKLQYIDTSRVGITGVDEGGITAFHLAATEERICASAVLANSRWTDTVGLYNLQTGIFDEEYSKFLYALSPQAYAQLIKKPMLMHLNTNPENSSFDDNISNFSRLPAKLRVNLSISVGADHHIGFRQKDNLIKWFNFHILYEGEYYTTPQAEIYSSGGKLYFKTVCAEPEKLKEIRVFYSYNETVSAKRNWHTLKADEISEGEYIAMMTVYEPDKYVYAYAELLFNNGVNVATKMITAKPAELGISKTQIAESRIIYDFCSGIDCFTVVKTNILIMEEPALAMEKGPLGLSGITAMSGNLATYKINDPVYYGYEGDSLQISYYSPISQTISVIIREYGQNEWLHNYIYTHKTEGGEVWQKLTLSPGNFKKDDGATLESWEQAGQLIIIKESKLLINGMIWI